MKDLFGEEVRTFPGFGYAGSPGRGPPGQTCADCEHFIRNERPSKTYFKCGLTRWTFGPATDIKARAPACEHFEAAVESPTQ